VTDTFRKVWLAIPCYGGHVHIGTMRSLIHDLIQLVAQGVRVQLFTDIGHADIYSARAQIVAHFLADADATDLVMIDNDVSWAPMGLVRLLDHDVDMVAGSYPKRELPIKFLVRSKDDTILADTASGLAEVMGVPGGFVRMRRAMLEKMAASYRDELLSVDRMTPYGETVRLFDPFWWKDADGNNRVLSEDYAFCERWRALGGKVFLDVTIPMGHIGQYEYAGQLGQWLKTPVPASAGGEKEKAA